MLAHRAQRRDGPRIEEPEIAGAFRQARVSDRAKELVEALRQHPPQGTIDIAAAALGEDVLVALSPARDESLDQFRRMLQIGIHDDGRSARSHDRGPLLWRSPCRNSG